MEYSDDLLKQYLPASPPPRQYVPGPVLDEIERWSPEEHVERGRLVARSTQWTYAMFAELHNGLVAFKGRTWFGSLAFRLARRFGRPAIGLFDPATSPMGFGLVFYVTRLMFLPLSWELGRVHFKRLEQSFPVRLQQAVVEDHNPPHPGGATSAAWARCDRRGLWGVLTAGHAVRGPGAGVALSSGSVGFVSRSELPRVDAAFVETSDQPDSPAELPIRRFPASGQRVLLQLRSGTVDRTVVEVENNLGVVRTLSRAALLFTDKCCSPGDSGALASAGNGDGVGIYLGGLDHPDKKEPLGRVLSLEQAVYALEVTPHR